MRSSGKAAYFLALFPYVVIITLLIQACTLDGAVDGILFFIKPQFSELLNPKASNRRPRVLTLTVINLLRSLKRDRGFYCADRAHLLQHDGM